jgi:hypothetical protein
MKLNGKQYDKFILNGKTYDKFYLNNKIYQSLDPGLILDLPLQNNFTDYSANGISMVAGNVNGLPSFVSDGSSGFALDFNGTKSIKTAVNLPINTSDKVSIEFNIKTTATVAQVVMELSAKADSNNAFYVTLNETAIGISSVNNSGGITNAKSAANVINNNQWHKVVVVHDRSLSASSEIAIYIDGNLKLLTTMYGLNGNVSGNFGSYPLFIGQRNGSSLGFVGQLKNLKIYNYPIL